MTFHIGIMPISINSTTIILGLVIASNFAFLINLWRHPEITPLVNQFDSWQKSVVWNAIPLGLVVTNLSVLLIAAVVSEKRFLGCLLTFLITSKFFFDAVAVWWERKSKSSFMTILRGQYLQGFYLSLFLISLYFFIDYSIIAMKVGPMFG